MFFESFLAQQAASPGPEACAGNAALVGLMLLVFYFMMIRPQQKQAKQHKEYLSHLKKGDEVVTASGIFGRIDAVEDSVVRLEITRDVKIRVLKSQIAGAQPGSTQAVSASEVSAKKE